MKRTGPIRLRFLLWYNSTAGITRRSTYGAAIMKTIHAVYENGVFRPTGPVELPEDCEVEFEPRLRGRSDDPAHLQRVQEILSRRYASGQTDLAARHNEHQP